MLGQIGAQFLAGNSAVRCLLNLSAALCRYLPDAGAPLVNKRRRHIKGARKINLRAARFQKVSVDVHRENLADANRQCNSKP